MSSTSVAPANDVSVETVRPVLSAMGFPADRIAAALNCLRGLPAEATDSEPLLTPKELCEQLKVSPTTLWRMKPPHQIVGQRKRYRLSQVLEFLKNRNCAEVEGVEDATV